MSLFLMDLVCAHAQAQLVLPQTCMAELISISDEVDNEQFFIASITKTTRPEVTVSAAPLSTQTTVVQAKNTRNCISFSIILS